MYAVRGAGECPFHSAEPLPGFHFTVFPHSANVIQEISLRLLLQFAQAFANGARIYPLYFLKENFKS
jgi:hypothetical protein